MTKTYLITARVGFTTTSDSEEDAAAELWGEFTRWLDRELRGVEHFDVVVGRELCHS